MRIGLIADTHMPGAIEDLWPQVFDAFRNVDCILHAGDLHTLGVVQQLERLAPTWVARGNGDAGIEDDRVRDNWVFEFAGISVGMIHRFPSPERRSGRHLSEYALRHFGGTPTPTVVVYGHTHLEAIHQIDGRLYVNPGSPTLPRNQSLRLGTIGLLEIEPGRVNASILQLKDDGAAPHEEVRPVQTMMETVQQT